MTSAKRRRREIRHFLLGISTSEVREKMSKLVPGAKVLGVAIPDLRDMVNAYHEDNKDLSFSEVCELTDELCTDKCREEILFGVFLISRHRKDIAGLAWRRLEKWVRAIDNWETCDQLASNVSGPLVAANLKYVDKLMPWTRATSIWKRRFAIATVSELNHKGMSHPKETFKVCQPLLADPNPMVSRAVGFAIREASKKDPDAAYKFLLKHKKVVSLSVLREASQKLPSKNKSALLG